MYKECKVYPYWYLELLEFLLLNIHKNYHINIDHIKTNLQTNKHTPHTPNTPNTPNTYIHTCIQTPNISHDQGHSGPVYAAKFSNNNRFMVLATKYS